jgi:hypothetical protein
MKYILVLHIPKLLGFIWYYAFKKSPFNNFEYPSLKFCALHCSKMLSFQKVNGDRLINRSVYGCVGTAAGTDEVVFDISGASWSVGEEEKTTTIVYEIM